MALAPTRTHRMVVYVEITGRDPHGLRPQCEDFCREHLLGEPTIYGLADREAHAQWLLQRFLATIAPNTTGADGLSVTIDLV